MNRSIRRVGYALTVLILVLIGQLTYLQVVDAHKLANDPRNARKVLSACNRARGEIVTSDGQIVAQSVPALGECKYLRRYPQGSLFAQVSGFQPYLGLVGNTGVEASYDKVLTGHETSLQLKNLGDFITGNADTENVVLSLSAKAQQTAKDALGDMKGSVVALDVKTGGVLAMYSNPSYDPNALAAHNTSFVQQAFNVINSDAAGKPALQRAYREIYAPGSTFKVVTAASAIENGLATPTEPVYPELATVPLPQTNQTLSNFGHPPEACGGNLTDSLVRSCNTVLGPLGLDLGEKFVATMQNCGIDTDPPPIDLEPAPAKSLGPTPGSFQSNKPNFAYAGIGQGPVSVTTLAMAMITQAIANGGVMLQPHVVKEIQNKDGTTVKTIVPTPWKQCMSAATASDLTGVMEQVVLRGTGTNAQIDGVRVAGKTGTAEASSTTSNLWFLAFAPADAPKYAVAVSIPNYSAPSGQEATGGEVAAPIARQMLQTLLATNPS